MVGRGGGGGGKGGEKDDNSRRIDDLRDQSAIGTAEAKPQLQQNRSYLLLVYTLKISNRVALGTFSSLKSARSFHGEAATTKQPPKQQQKRDYSGKKSMR